MTRKTKKLQVWKNDYDFLFNIILMDPNGPFSHSVFYFMIDDIHNNKFTLCYFNYIRFVQLTRKELI